MFEESMTPLLTIQILYRTTGYKSKNKIINMKQFRNVWYVFNFQTINKNVFLFSLASKKLLNQKMKMYNHFFKARAKIRILFLLVFWKWEASKFPFKISWPLVQNKRFYRANIWKRNFLHSPDSSIILEERQLWCSFLRQI